MEKFTSKEVMDENGVVIKAGDMGGNLSEFRSTIGGFPDSGVPSEQTGQHYGNSIGPTGNEMNPFGNRNQSSGNQEE